MVIDLKIYDLTGRIIRVLDSGEKISGTHQVIWDSRDANSKKVPSGVYFIRLKGGNLKRVARCIVLR